MPYKVKVWIPCDEEDITVYPSQQEAVEAKESMSLMQPENHYEVIWCDKEGKEI
jgi:hypothetical protein